MGELLGQRQTKEMTRKSKGVSTRASPANRAIYFIQQHPHLVLSSLIVLACIVRFAALLDLKRSIYFDFLLWDERLYHTWAKRIAEGSFQSSSVYEMAPLPAYFMALVYKITSPDVFYIRIVNIILGVLTCYLVYLIGKDLATRATGLLACLLTALYKPFIFFSIVPLKTSLSIFLFALSLYFLLFELRRHSWFKVFLLGTTLGLLHNVRPNFLAIIPVVAIVILVNTYGAYKGRTIPAKLGIILALYVAGLCVAAAPFTIRNWLATGQVASITSQSGFNLYICNNLRESYPVPFASTSPFEQGVQFTIEASRRVGKKLSPQEASSYWTREVVRMALQQPYAFMKKILRKIGVFLNYRERGDHYHIGFVSDFARFFKFPFFGFWFVMPLGMAGMAINMFRSRQVMTLAVVFLVYTATLIIFFPTLRLRLPVLVVLIPLAVVGLDSLVLFIKTRERKKVGVYFSVAVVFFVVEFLPTQGTGDMTAYYNTHAIILNTKGLEEEAVRYWEMSSEMGRHFSDFANLSLAQKYHKRGNIPRAMEYLDKISQDSYAAAAKYAFFGDMMMFQGDVTSAIQAYEKSLDINSGQRRIRKKLVKIYDEIDKRRAFEEYQKLKYISSFYDLY